MEKLKPQGVLQVDSPEFPQDKPFLRDTQAGSDRCSFAVGSVRGMTWASPEGTSPPGYDLTDLRKPAQPQRYGDGL